MVSNLLDLLGHFCSFWPSLDRVPGKTVVFGAISIDGMQFFRQYNKFIGETFLDYLKKLHRHYGKLYLFMDKAKHYNTDVVT